MSTPSTTFGAHGAAAPTARSQGSVLGRILQRLVEAREAQARRYVDAHLATLTDDRLAALGYTPAEIARLRRTAAAAPAPMIWS